MPPAIHVDSATCTGSKTTAGRRGWSRGNGGSRGNGWGGSGGGSWGGNAISAAVRSSKKIVSRRLIVAAALSRIKH